jgi:thiol-disulfide isomerase/thioredoxin
MMKSKLFILMISLLSSSWSFANESLIRQVSQSQGFFFFYSASCPHCQRFAPVLKQFSDFYGFKVVAISLDGGLLSSFPQSVMDNGQKNTFQVTVLPSLFLVDPIQHKAALVTEGAIDANELLKRIEKIISPRHPERSEGTPNLVNTRRSLLRRDDSGGGWL